MKRLSLLMAMIVCASAMAENPPATLGEQLERDNPVVIACLENLTDADIGKKLKGVKLSDGTVELKGAVYLGSALIPKSKQHIYVLKDDGTERAYAWVDKGGKPLLIPKDKKGSVGEDASVLSGDIYTFTEVAPGDGVVILWGGSMAWLNGLKK